MKRRTFLKGLAAIFGISLVPVNPVKLEENPKRQYDFVQPYFVEGSVWVKEIPKYRDKAGNISYIRGKDGWLL